MLTLNTNAVPNYRFYPQQMAKSLVHFGTASEDKLVKRVAAKVERDGVRQARELKETTPVEPLLAQPTQIAHIRIKKVNLNRNSGDTAVPAFSLSFVDKEGKEHPWVTPKANDSDFYENSAAFFSAHDVSNHAPLNRFRTINPMDPPGEMHAGQIPGTEQLCALDAKQISGLVFNAVHHRMKKESQSNAPETSTPISLMNLLERLESKDIPVGTTFNLVFKLPAPDVAVRMTESNTQQVSIPLSRKLPNNLIPGSRQKLKELDAQLEQDISFEPPKLRHEGYKTFKTYTKTIDIPTLWTPDTSLERPSNDPNDEAWFSKRNDFLKSLKNEEWGTALNKLQELQRESKEAFFIFNPDSQKWTATSYYKEKILAPFKGATHDFLKSNGGKELSISRPGGKIKGIGCIDNSNTWRSLVEGNNDSIKLDESFSKKITQKGTLIQYHQFILNGEDDLPIEGTRYYFYRQAGEIRGKQISWSEGEKIKTGYTATQNNQTRRSYRIPDPGGDGEKLFSYLDKHVNLPEDMQHKIFPGYFEHTRKHPMGGEVVYTGRPYRECVLQRFSFGAPEGQSIPSLLEQELHALATQYQENFIQHEKQQKELYETGTLPVTEPISPFINAPVSLLEQLKQVASDWKTLLQDALERSQNPAEFITDVILKRKDSDNVVASFPPPPRHQQRQSVLSRMEEFDAEQNNNPDIRLLKTHHSNASVESLLEKQEDDEFIERMSWADIREGVQRQADTRPHFVPEAKPKKKSASKK